MNAAEVHEALAARWPDEEYLKIKEAPADDGRNIDLLVLSLWKSRGYEIDAVEIKVSLADARREINGTNTKRGRQGGPAKADWWYRHSHRFWMAVPEAIAVKVLEELPELWGLLVVGDSGRVTAKRKAPKHEAEPLEWGTVINLMRCASAAGFSALGRASQLGYQRGVESAKREYERSTPDGAAQRELQRLQSDIEDFERVSGVSITGYGGDELGFLVAIVRQYLTHPQWEADKLDRIAKTLEDQRKSVVGLARDLRAALCSPTPA